MVSINYICFSVILVFRGSDDKMIFENLENLFLIFSQD
jgi:hypothetical protein